MSFALLKKACDGCRESSVKTYWANIKSLARLSGRDDVPFGGSWLSDKLLKRVLSEPINRSKRFTTAGVKAAQMYRVKKPKWITAMSETTDKYATQRQSGKRTKREAENWPEGGQGTNKTSKGVAQRSSSPRKKNALEHPRPLSLPAIPYCSIL